MLLDHICHGSWSWARPITRGVHGYSVAALSCVAEHCLWHVSWKLTSLSFHCIQYMRWIRQFHGYQVTNISSAMSMNRGTSWTFLWHDDLTMAWRWTFIELIQSYLCNKALDNRMDTCKSYPCLLWCHEYGAIAHFPRYLIHHCYCTACMLGSIIVTAQPVCSGPSLLLCSLCALVHHYYCTACMLGSIIVTAQPVCSGPSLYCAACMVFNLFWWPASLLGEHWYNDRVLDFHYVYPCQRFSTGNTLEDYNP
jgi:hypothetical protein